MPQRFGFPADRPSSRFSHEKPEKQKTLWKNVCTMMREIGSKIRSLLLQGPDEIQLLEENAVVHENLHPFREKILTQEFIRQWLVMLEKTVNELPEAQRIAVKREKRAVTHFLANDPRGVHGIFSSQELARKLDALETAIRKMRTSLN